MTIFIIGPGGVGKTTAGTILATRLQYSFIDLDQEFCNQIENIGSYIKNNNYEKYYSKNSELFFKLLKNNKKTNNIFVLSSGFLANHEVKEFYSLHVEAIKKNGLSILLLPSQSIKKSTKIVVERQMKRGLNLVKKVEAEKFIKRFEIYNKLGDIKIYSDSSPQKIAELMEHTIATFLPSQPT